MNNEICYFHRKELEIKTSFRQGYVENCERECEHLKELVVRMYKEVTEGNPIKTVELVAKDGHPNVTSLMHAYGVALGEDFLGSYEAREARLASEGQPILTHNGKGDIVLPRDDVEAHQVLASVEENNEPRDGHDHVERISHSSRSPTPDHYTSTNSQPMSRQSSTGSLFSDHSIPKRPSTVDEDMVDVDVARSRKRRSLHRQQLPISPAPQLLSTTTVTSQNESTTPSGVDNWSNIKPDWTPSTPFSSTHNNVQGFQGNFSDGFLSSKNPMNRFNYTNSAMATNSQFSPSRQRQPLPFSYVSPDNMFVTDMQQGFSEPLSPEDMQLPTEGFFADNFIQAADSSVPFDYLESPVF